MAVESRDALALQRQRESGIQIRWELLVAGLSRRERAPSREVAGKPRPDLKGFQDLFQGHVFLSRRVSNVRSRSGGEILLAGAGEAEQVFAAPADGYPPA